MITKLNKFINESNYEILTGILQKNGSVIAEDGTIHWPGTRGTDKYGYPEILIDAKKVGGDGCFYRQSVKPYIGMTVKFVRHGGKKYQGYNFEIVPNKPIEESVRDLMKPKSDEEIRKIMKSITPNEKVRLGCVYSDLWMIKQGLEEGADNQEHAISIAVVHGDIELVKFLLDNSNIDDYTKALNQACLHNHIDIIKLLIEHGADVHKIRDTVINNIRHNRRDVLMRLLDKHGLHIEPMTI